MKVNIWIGIKVTIFMAIIFLLGVIAGWLLEVLKVLRTI